MRRVVGLLVVLACGGCGSTAGVKEAQPTADLNGNVAETMSPQERVLRADGTYGKIPANGAPAPAPKERPRSVALPDVVELVAPGAMPALPAVVTVAVAFVRAGKLAHCDRALRRLDHELGRDQGATVVALEPLGKDAPDSVTLDELARAASAQRAHLLLVDVRQDDQDAESTTFVLDAESRKFLAHTKPRAIAPEGGDLVARLVLSARKQTP